MKKENIINFSEYEEKRSYSPNSMSDELKEAIQGLIDRLRDRGPLPASSRRYPTQINKKARQQP